MKNIQLAYIVATPDVQHYKHLKAFHGHLEEAFCKLSQKRYNGVELLIRYPHCLNLDEMDRLAEKYQLEIPVINTGEIYVQDSLSFIDANECIRCEAVHRIKDVIEAASHFGALVTIGKVRGELSGAISYDTGMSWMYAALHDILGYAEEKGVTIALEPISAMACNTINTAHDAVELIKSMEKPNLKLMADVFHMNLEEKSLEESLKAAAPYLVHIHIADSNRMPPGRGNLNFEEIISLLDSLSYKGYLSAEVLQYPSQDMAMYENIQLLRYYL